MKTQSELISTQRALGDTITAISWNAKTGKRVLTYSGLSFAKAITELVNKTDGIIMKLYVGLDKNRDGFDLLDADAVAYAENYRLKV